MTQRSKLGLPDYLKIIAERLTGRPIDAILWCESMIALAIVWLIWERRSPTLALYYSGHTTLEIGFGVFASLIVLANAVTLGFRNGWRWLIEPNYLDRDNQVDHISRFIIRAAPIVGVLIVVEYMVL